MKFSNDFEVLFSPKSYKQMEQLDEELKERIKKAVIKIGNDPWHRGTINVKSHENIMRKRVGRYRLLYTIDREKKEVLIIKVEKRGETTYNFKF